MKIVIDGDQMLYAAGFASEGEPRSHTYHLLKKAMEDIFRGCRTEQYELYLSGEGNFREDLAVTQGYKANRTDRKPESYDDAKSYLIGSWGAQTVDGMETDDKVSIELWKDYCKHGGDKSQTTIILSSPDKDLNNTPGWHYNPRTKKLSWIGETQAYRHFLYQLLMGDRVDNIRGLPRIPEDALHHWNLKGTAKKGVGAGTAKQIMSCSQTCNAGELDVYRAYCAWGKNANLESEEVLEYLEEQGQLLWMVRELHNNKPVMWSPDNDLFELASKEMYGEAESS